MQFFLQFGHTTFGKIWNFQNILLDHSKKFFAPLSITDLIFLIVSGPISKIKSSFQFHLILYLQPDHLIFFPTETSIG